MKKNNSKTLCACGCGNEIEQKPGIGRMRKFIEGHRKAVCVRTGTKYCACGCGGVIPKRTGYGGARKFLDGHKRAKAPKPEKKPKPVKQKKAGRVITTICQCGCNREFSYTYKSGPKTRYIKAHRPIYARERELHAKRVASRKVVPIQLRIGFCGCGCGQLVTEKVDTHGKPIFARGHEKPEPHPRLGAVTPEEVRSKISDALKEKYKDPAYKNKVAEAVAAAFPHTSPSEPTMRPCRNPPHLTLHNRVG